MLSLLPKQQPFRIVIEMPYLRLPIPKFLAYLALTAAAVAGNSLALTLSFGVDFLFGSIFILLILSVFGVWPGVLAAVIAGLPTHVLWGHPYGALNFTIEALFIGLLLHRASTNLPLLAGVYWLLIGMPLAALLYGLVLDFSSTATLLVMFKQGVNGVLNALVASLILTHVPLLRRYVFGTPTPPLFQLLFNVSVALVLLPAFLLLLFGSPRDKAATESQAASELSAASSALRAHLGEWRSAHRSAVEQLAEHASELVDPSTEGGAETLRRSFRDFDQVYVTDRTGIIIAASPPGTEGRAVGTDVSDQLAFLAPREDLRTSISPIFLPEHATTPLFTVSAPVILDGEFHGVAVGRVDLSRITDNLNTFEFESGMNATLVEADGTVIASSDPNIDPLLPLGTQRGGVLRSVRDDLYIVEPEPEEMPEIQRWADSFYGQTSIIGGGNWVLVVETPLAPYQEELQEHYLVILALVFVMIPVAFGIAFLTASRLNKPLSRLAEVTRNLPRRFQNETGIAWPRSNIAELQQLISNFQATVHALQSSFQDKEDARRTLEQRSEELDRINTNLTTQVEQRKRLEEGQSFLASASEALASLEYDEVLAKIGDIAVPRFADLGVFYAIGDEGAPNQVLVFHEDPERRGHITEMINQYPPLEYKHSLLNQVLQTRRPVLLADVSTETLQEHAQTAEHLDLLKRLSILSAMYLPCQARGRIKGVLIFGISKRERRYDEFNLAVGLDFARRVAVALDNAELHAALQETVHLRDEFVSIASHELRTPLTTLSLQIAMAAKSVASGKEAPEALAKRIERAQQQVERLSRLINTLLDISRVQSETFRLEKESFDLVDLINDAVERSQIDRTLLHRSLPAMLPGRWDKLRLEQVVTNLLSNAARYAAGTPIHITLTSDEQWTRLVVRDEGPGIDPAIQDRIFQRFERAAHDAGGLGLGLYISRQIVEAHGGTIRVESEPGKGASFIVDLPLQC